ncbi:MAG TPA: MFS transporter, partial [Caulobacteraceae bacterium]|nr:MFS transporter [Caulobacteraceae bacterium]
GSPWIPVILVADLFVAATLLIIGLVIMGSMVADVAEDSAVKTGVRSEGLLFAARGLLPKITAGVGGLIGNLMLEFVHFPAAAKAGKAVVVDPSVMRHLALISLPAGVVLNLIAISVLAFYRIDRSKHEANLEALRLAAAGDVGPPNDLQGGAVPLGEPRPVTRPV